MFKTNNIQEYWLPLAITIVLIVFLVKYDFNTDKSSEIVTKYLKDSNICLNVNISSYQLTHSQTDSNPLESASGKNLTKHPNACAISIDLKLLYDFGDTIMIVYNGISKNYIVEDIMNKRYSNRVDLLTKENISTTGYAIKPH